MTCGKVDKSGDNLSGPMLSALRWMASGNEVDCDLINQYGRSAEMPRRSTLQALADRGLVAVERRLGGFSVQLTSAGKARASR